MAKNLAPSKVRHLNKLRAYAHLKPSDLRIIVDIPWTVLERRLGTTLKTNIFRRKRRVKEIELN
jgi:hypothetical protein